MTTLLHIRLSYGLHFLVLSWHLITNITGGEMIIADTDCPRVSVSFMLCRLQLGFLDALVFNLSRPFFKFIL